jgi:hypothetical protein
MTIAMFDDRIFGIENELPLDIEQEEVMSPNKYDQLIADIATLRGEIAKLSPAKGGLKQKFLIPALTVLGSIAVSVITPVALVKYVFKSQISDLVSDKLKSDGLDKVPGDLATLQESVRGIKDNVTLLLQNALKTTAFLAQPQFNRNLKAVAVQLGLAKQANAKLDEATRNALREKLLESDLSKDEDLWKARISFLAYESASSSIVDWNKTGQNLPLCTNAPMTNLTFDADFRCRIDLDGMKLRNVQIKNAIVTYRGGPTSLDNITLTNCYLFLDIKNVPDRGGQKFIENLLASASVPTEVSISG